MMTLIILFPVRFLSHPHLYSGDRPRGSRGRVPQRGMRNAK